MKEFDCAPGGHSRECVIPKVPLLTTITLEDTRKIMNGQ